MLLLESVAYLLRGDRAEELALIAGLRAHGDGDLTELLCICLGLGLFARHLRSPCLFLELERIYIVGRRFACELARQKVVACVAVGDLL